MSTIKQSLKAKKCTVSYKTFDGKDIQILKNHIKSPCKKFFNGVCVSACVSYLGIEPNQYDYTWSLNEGNRAPLNTMKKFGFRVGLRNETFKGATTVNQLIKLIKKHNNKEENVVYYVGVRGHVLLINSEGKVVVDTDPRFKADRRRVLSVYAVFK